jgi:hypothetical protein
VDPRVVGIGLGLACAALGAAGAWADDLAPAATTVAQPAPYVTLFQEVRLGAYAHNVIHNEDAPVDVSVETLSSPVVFANVANPWVSWFFDPRINLGAMVNTGGKTSYAFTGLTWRIPVYGPVFFEGEFGGAVNNAVRQPTPDRVDMGCEFTFRESGGFGVQLTSNVDLIFNVEHVSHATFCTHINPGITDFGFRVGYKF